MYLIAQETDLRSLVKYTDLPYIWDIFSDVISLSPMDDRGFTLQILETYLNGLEPLQMTHQEFWKTIRYFLMRINEKLAEKRKQKTGGH